MRCHLALACFAILGCTEAAKEQGRQAAPHDPTPTAQPPTQRATRPPEAPKQETLTEAHHAALKYLTSGEEPKVKDATWTAPTILKIGVIDDGTRRDGLADYFCLALADYTLPKPLLLSIIDINKLRAAGDWVELGKNICK